MRFEPHQRFEDRRGNHASLLTQLWNRLPKPVKSTYSTPITFFKKTGAEFELYCCEDDPLDEPIAVLSVEKDEEGYQLSFMSSTEDVDSVIGNRKVLYFVGRVLPSERSSSKNTLRFDKKVLSEIRAQKQAERQKYADGDEEVTELEADNF